MEHNGEFVAGTVRLLDVSNSSGDPSTIIRIPVPTNNINDPLNWSKGRKIWVGSILLAWTFLANAAVAWTPPAWAIWTVEFETTFTKLTYAQGLLVLLCGVGSWLLQPYALKFGRRPVYAFGSILMLVGLAAGAVMTGINGLFAYFALAGFGSAPSYATIITSLIDMTFLHQKGRILGLYGIVLILGNFLPPVAAGYITDSQGWRWCLYYLIIFFSLSSLVFLFGAEETLFPRGNSSVVVNTGIDDQRRHSSIAVSSTAQKPDCIDSAEANLGTTFENVAEQEISGAESAHTSVPLRRYTYLQQMTLFRRNVNVRASYLRLTLEVFEVGVLPAPMWASFMIAIGTFVVSYVFTTQALFFSLPPYNFDASQLGLMYFALIIGNFIGAFYGGNVADWIVQRKAKSNGGVSEAEHRLWAYLPVPLLGAGGVLLYGVGASQGLHWVVPCLGLVLIGIYLNAALPISLGYALDSYVDISGEIVQFSNFFRNVLGGAFTFGIQPWVDHNGPQNTSIIIAILVLVLNFTSVPFQIWGKSIRRRTAKTYIGLTKRNTYY